MHVCSSAGNALTRFYIGDTLGDWHIKLRKGIFGY